MNGNKYGVTGTNTMTPCELNDIPKNKCVTYGTVVCDHRPNKPEKFRSRLVVGGDKLPYAHDSAAPAANLLESKLILNSTISQRQSKFFCIDIKDFFLSSNMPEPEYMKLHISEIPQDIIDQYDLTKYMDKNKFVYFKITKGMYGLKQAAKLAYDQLVKNLAPHGYYPVPNTVGIWKHTTRKTKFCLCVDDFGIQYHTQADAQHLIDTLKRYYTITIDWSGTSYCGLNIEWNYKERFVDISMPGYIKKLITRIKHPPPKKPVHAPHKWHEPIYGKHRQYGTPEDTSDLLPPKESTHAQSIIGSLLYYARAVDPSMLPGLNEVSVSQANPTRNTMKKVNTLLDYVTTHPNAVIRYHASDMCLHVDSDAAYLVLPRARSRLAGHYYLSDDPQNARTPAPNGPILTECRTIRHVVASSAEAETSALFHNAQTAIPIRHVLSALGHPQPRTPLKTDNATANAFVSRDMRHKKSKAWDMRYWWLKEKTAKNTFDIFWEKGITNWADYFTKHFSPKIHQALRPRYIHRTYAIIEQSLTNLLTSRTCEGVLEAGPTRMDRARVMHADVIM